MQVLHFRVVVPRDLREAAVSALLEDPAVADLAVMPSTGTVDEGALILCDVARDGASRLLQRLRGLGVDERGSISVQALESTFSRSAREAEAAAPGFALDAVVWQEIDQYARDEARLSGAFLIFLAVATQIAAIGVINDSPILIVGAMVLGPEFGPIAAICIGLYRGDPGLMLAAARTLLIGFVVAVAVTCACALAARALGWITTDTLALKPLTGFIVHPDRWSFIVALLAGAAGMLAITSARATSLVGVFISVTTVPAAGNAAVAIAIGNWTELGGSAEQLAINIVGMIGSGTLALIALRLYWATVSDQHRQATRQRLLHRPRASR